MNCYCVKCKKTTQTTNPKYSLSKNQKPMMKGNCRVCKKNKCKFISADEAKRGGFIFTVPALLAGLGAAGSLAGGAAGIATAVNKSKAAKQLLAETKRHNKVMEAKAGKGLFLGPRKKGKGLYLKPSRK